MNRKMFRKAAGKISRISTESLINAPAELR